MLLSQPIPTAPIRTQIGGEKRNENSKNGWKERQKIPSDAKQNVHREWERERRKNRRRNERLILLMVSSPLAKRSTYTRSTAQHVHISMLARHSLRCTQLIPTCNPFVRMLKFSLRFYHVVHRSFALANAANFSWKRIKWYIAHTPNSNESGKTKTMEMEKWIKWMYALRSANHTIANHTNSSTSTK